MMKIQVAFALWKTNFVIKDVQFFTKLINYFLPIIAA